MVCKMDPDIEETIAKVFYDSKRGFGSVDETYRRAKELKAGVTRAAVRAFIAKQEIRQQRKPAKKKFVRCTITTSTVSRRSHGHGYRESSPLRFCLYRHLF